MITILKKVDDFISKLLKILLVIIFTVLTVTALLQVFFRFVMQNPLTWTDEVCRYCLIWLTLLGIGVASQRKSHISIDIICNVLPKKVLAVLRKFWNICAIVFCIIVFKYGAQLVVLNMAQYSAGMHIQLGYIYISVPAGALFILYYNAIQLFNLDQKFAGLDGVKKEEI